MESLASTHVGSGQPARAGFRRSPRLLLAAGLAAICSAAWAAPVTCADMQAKIEAQYKAKGVVPPPLKIVPKSLVAGMQVLGSCENGTQRIAYRPSEAAAAPASGAAKGKP